MLDRVFAIAFRTFHFPLQAVHSNVWRSRAFLLGRWQQFNVKALLG